MLAAEAGRCCAFVVARDSFYRFSLPRRSRLKSAWPGESIAFKTMKTVSRRPRISLETKASFEEIAHNQVLMAALAASFLGQILKPFSSALEGKGFNWKLIWRSGGLPSSHSAAVTATCTSLALERGFADSLFGLSVVFASIVIYDSQGVRRQVGKQAEVINTLVLSSVPDSSIKSNETALSKAAQYASVSNEERINLPVEPERDTIDDSEYSKQRLRVMAPAMLSLTDEKTIMRLLASKQSGGSLKNSEFDGTVNKIDEENGAYTRSQAFFELAKKLPSVEAGQVDLQELGSLDGLRHVPLKESVGHTKVEVIVGCLWGIFIAIALSQLNKAGVW